MKSLPKKLLEIQKELGVIKKDLTNPYFNSKYADINSLLELLKPILNKYSVVVLQPILITNGANFLQTVIIDTESEEELSSSFKLPDIQDPQKIGSCITYFRRYALQSLFLMQAEDDDGNVASSGNKLATSIPVSLNKDVPNVSSKPISQNTCRSCGKEISSSFEFCFTCKNQNKKINEEIKNIPF